ncbi:MAG: ribonuclease T2 family protein [Ferrovibrio sp.]
MMLHRKLAFLLLLLLPAALSGGMPAGAQTAQSQAPQCRIPAQIEVQACSRPEQSRELPRGRPGDFDHYILSLSWSPAFCATKAGERSPVQCRDNAFGWVVHGLWPEYRHKRDGGSWPQYCAAVQPVPAEVLRRTMCAMPDTRLMQCQWLKHGSCSDFTDPAAYFAIITRLRERLVLPEPGPRQAAKDYAAVLAAANADKGLTVQSLRALAQDGVIREVHVCISRDFTRFIPCKQPRS